MDTQRDPATGNGPDGAGTAPGPERPRLTVAVLTYLRNAYLAELLPALIEQAGSVAGRARVRVLVVDNDPAGGAEQTAAGARPDGAGPEIVYVHEPEPGIVAGRNRALDESAHEHLLVFIDDDELPRPGWLAALLAARERHGCAAVTGPTPPVFETAPDPWVAACGVFDSWEAADGARVRSADTGNLLLDLGRVRALRLRFDPRYGLTGGEDSLFTRSLTLAGEEIRFAAGAVVDKRVPARRARREWVLRRARRSGSTWARVRIDTAPRARAALRLGYAAKGLARAGRDGALALLARARGDVASRAVHEVSARGGLGMVVGALGGSVAEYGRPAGPGASGASGVSGEGAS
ncbi:glycosyltransferase family 2 protein [uncultured Actinomyces sp.]|uniref:glycosyltransferase family 2 protein n=1 Tax=uncultured Actinomyces sp. TaxID=249061 RepID=UPI0037DC6518